MISKKMYLVVSIICSFFISHASAQQISQHHYSLNKKEWPWAIASQNKVSVLLLGDTNIQGRHQPEQAFQHLMPTLNEASVRFLNLEGPFSPPSEDPAKQDIPYKEHWRHSEPRMVEALIKAKIDAVGVANNVTYPRDVLMHSLQVLDSARIRHAGGGKNIEEAHKPVIIEKDRVRIGFLQYTATYWPYNHTAEENLPGVAGLKIYTSYTPPKQVLDKPGQPPIIITEPDQEALNRMKNDISSLRPKVDIVVASFHWGISGQHEIVGYEQKLAYAAIESGADIIMGHGNHLIQAIEVYNHKPIFYGLGNSAFDWYRVTDKRHGLLVRALITPDDKMEVSFVPLSRDAENDPVLLDPNFGLGNTLYKQTKSLSKDFGTNLSIQKKEIVVYGIQ